MSKTKNLPDPYQELQDALAKYRGIAGPAERRTFKDAGLAARARVDRIEAQAEIDAASSRLLASDPDIDPDALSAAIRNELHGESE